MHTHVHTHTHTQMHAHMHTHMDMHPHTRSHTHECTYTIHTHKHIYTCTYTHTHTHAHTHTDIHTHPHTHTHTHTHTHNLQGVPGWFHGCMEVPPLKGQHCCTWASAPTPLTLFLCTETVHLHFTSVQDGTYALRKAHMHSIPISQQVEGILFTSLLLFYFLSLCLKFWCILEPKFSWKKALYL